jgi:hypothetical protein
MKILNCNAEFGIYIENGEKKALAVVIVPYN